MEPGCIGTSSVEINTKASGLTIKNTEKADKSTLMGQNSKVSIKMAWNKVMGSTRLLMEANTKEISMKTKSPDMGPTAGKMARATLDIG